MDNKTFERLLNTYGSDLSRWPEPQRQQAGEHLKQPEAMKQFNQEKLFDAFLLSEPCEPPRDFLLKLKDQLNTNIENDFSHVWLPLAPKLAALSFALAIGFLASFLDFGQSFYPIYFDEIALDLSQQQGEEE